MASTPLTPVHEKPPLVLVPGIQGRWEWMAPAIAALSRSFDVRTFSLGVVARPGQRPAAENGPGLFDRWHDQIDDLMGTGAACTVVGVSFGGVIAATFASARAERLSRLVLVSAPSPRFRLDSRQTAYLRHPLTSLPAFALRGAGRLAPEVMAALPTWRERCQFAAIYGVRTLIYPASPRQMASWAREWMTGDLTERCQAVRVPTLVITGDPSLDRVVPVSSSLEYLTLIPGSQHARIENTGHLGFLLKPEVFAEMVERFASAGDHVPPDAPRTTQEDMNGQ